jgi:hypothetical protein
VLTNIAPFSLQITAPLDSELSNNVTLVYWQLSDLYLKTSTQGNRKILIPRKILTEKQRNPNTTINDIQNVQQKLNPSHPH